MAIVNLEGVVVEANPALCQMLGDTYDELSGRHVRTILHPDDLAIHSDAVRVTTGGAINTGRGRRVQ